MTVNFEVPVVEYTGNASSTVFTFDWSSGDANDIYVQIDGVLATEGVEYELENYDGATGGEIVFEVAPVTGTLIRIYRQTPITQQVDYEEGEPFQAETHEEQLDKDTRILQEINAGVYSEGGGVDLSADQQPDYTDIVNTAGTDARVLPWTTDGLKSGVALGEVVPNGGALPTDSDPTTKPDGYIWWGLGVPAQGEGDAEITMWTNALTVASSEEAPSIPRAEFAYKASTGEIGYGYDQLVPAQEPAFIWHEAFATPVTVPATYLIKLEAFSGDAPSGSALDTYLDVTADASWYLNSGTFKGIVRIAPDDGAGNPVVALEVSRWLNLSAEQT